MTVGVCSECGASIAGRRYYCLACGTPIDPANLPPDPPPLTPEHPTRAVRPAGMPRIVPAGAQRATPAPAAQPRPAHADSRSVANRYALVIVGVLVVAVIAYLWAFSGEDSPDQLFSEAYGYPVSGCREYNPSPPFEAPLPGQAYVCDGGLGGIIDDGVVTRLVPP